ncbi:MAG: GTP 3',8-cyclase MoaA [Fimbriimonadaceae bacterium]|nr:GTP 3',8-cyclase MoaA [Fimbriimonadaceae bacterium]
MTAHALPKDLHTRRAPLTDRFGRVHTYLRVSVTDRCNLRCVYCMPEEGVVCKSREEILSFEEIARLTTIFAECGVSKVRLTGGEPTVRKDLPDLVRSLAKIEGIKDLLLTTNGIALAKHAALYRGAGISGVNISLDTLRPDRFFSISRRDGLSQVLDGIQAALEVGFEPVKLNMVVMKGVNEDEILDFVELARTMLIQVRFIEFMPFQANGWSAGGLYPFAEMKRDIETAYRLAPIDACPGAVATEFSIENGEGNIGFITSMTHNFCSGCNRVRLTADGQMKNCLFSTSETNLRDAMRSGASDDALTEIIRECVMGKWKEHPPMGLLERLENRSMVQIGG